MSSVLFVAGFVAASAMVLVFSGWVATRDDIDDKASIERAIESARNALENLVATAEVSASRDKTRVPLLGVVAKLVGFSAEERARYVEEWCGELAELPSPRTRRRWLISLVLGIPQMRRVQREPARELQ